jgi:deazaflavin-dependent oxidoreductase (nitroreductase family)
MDLSPTGFDLCMATKEQNAPIIEEFRTNEGHVGGPFENIPLLLLHTTGAKSGAERVNPLAYRRDGDALVVFGSKGGAPTDPDWIRNVVANPKVSVEVGADRHDAVARIAEGDERERIWSDQKREFPGFADYEKATTRVIPVVVLDPA